MIPYGRQAIGDDDIAAVVSVLKSDFLTQGPAVPAFEQAVARRCEAQYAVAVNSATSALHIACLALGVGAGDRVWTSPITFVASANAAVYCGASVDFVDIDPRTYCMSASALEAKLTQAERAGMLPKVVIPVHLAGQSCDMAAIYALSQRYGFATIEDAAHAIGGTYRDKPIGACEFSDITVFSFHPVKVITTGEGGMALTNNGKLAATMSLLRSHGITRDAAHMEAIDPEGWHYEQQALGFNYRMADLAAALGVSQLAKLDDFVARRREIARFYDTVLAAADVTTPYQDPATSSAWHLYIVRTTGNAGGGHRELFDRLRAAGIGVNLHYMPVYRQPYYRRLGFAPGYCPEAENYYSDAISLPIFPAMTETERDQVVKAVAEALAR